MSRYIGPLGDLEDEFAHAVRTGCLSLRYQPIVVLATGEIVGVEALVRWEHPSRGTISPSDFIPLAERSGLIVPIDRWVLHTACEQVKAWQHHFPRHATLVASVNLSARLVSRRGLVDDVRQTLATTGLDPACLRLEVTETVLMQDSTANIRTLHALRQLGVGIAIDDFGTGYSSLSYLRWLPADILKLDRSFVIRLGKDSRDAVIVQGLVGIAQGLGMTVTAEGIETEQQWTELTRLGCNRGQGYYFAPPLTADDLTTLLHREGLGHPAIGVEVGAACSAAGTTGKRRGRVLVVDDDEPIRHLASCALELEGYEVIVAEDGADALEQIEQQPPDLIVLDVMMPGMDGLRFSQAYHARAGNHAPLVVLSAVADVDTCAAEVGAASYLRKPVEIETFLETIDRLVTTGAS